MGSGLINFSISHDVGIITLNRPEARNALSTEMFNDLAEAIRSCRSPDVRAVLITGSGEAFCAGADVRQFDNRLEDGGPQGISSHLREAADGFHKHVILEIRRLEKPVVAGINGVAAGAGFSLTLGCDLRVAANSARFMMAYANIGATADGGSTYLLPRLVGTGKAMEIYLASQPIGAQAALEMGLVNQVVGDEELHRHAMETAVRLAQGPTVAYGRVKAMFDRSWDTDLAAQLNLETEAIADSGLTADFQEGIKAFTERRQPRFEGK